MFSEMSLILNESEFEAFLPLFLKPNLLVASAAELFEVGCLSLFFYPEGVCMISLIYRCKSEFEFVECLN